MPRPETDIEAGRQKLMEVADRLIAEKGAISFTMTDLASEAGMSQSNVYRFFESKDALAEAMAGEWFADLTAMMENLVDAEMPAKDKLFQFFAQRMKLKQERFKEDPDLFNSYMELGDQHFEVVRGYVDLADHYMAIILAEAMNEGHFKGYALDQVVTLVNVMFQPFCNPTLMMQMIQVADEERLAIVIDTVFSGLQVHNQKSDSKPSKLELVNG